MSHEAVDFLLDGSRSCRWTDLCNFSRGARMGKGTASVVPLKGRKSNPASAPRYLVPNRLYGRT